MSFDNPIRCQTFGAGITIDNDEAAVFIVMGEDPDEPTHGVLLTTDGFTNFLNRCMALAIEMAAINSELDGLVGEQRNERVQLIQERYAAGLN